MYVCMSLVVDNVYIAVMSANFHDYWLLLLLLLCMCTELFMYLAIVVVVVD